MGSSRPRSLIPILGFDRYRSDQRAYYGHGTMRQDTTGADPAQHTDGAAGIPPHSPELVTACDAAPYFLTFIRTQPATECLQRAFRSVATSLNLVARPGSPACTDWHLSSRPELLSVFSECVEAAQLRKEINTCLSRPDPAVLLHHLSDRPDPASYLSEIGSDVIFTRQLALSRCCHTPAWSVSLYYGGGTEWCRAGVVESEDKATAVVALAPQQPRVDPNPHLTRSVLSSSS